ncbi:homoserine dehydrogenase [Oleispira antarctica]|uniref:Homoserine dehydrogenase n=1 Tax=Oleispira antarctica TaxID=188908 RepID=A0A1Y5HU76_OLEAN|nr:homoserine dehydrogenase [Oleispira antarctica]
MKPVKVGICGFGTVGGGTFNVLTNNASEISRRAGRDIIIEQVGARRDNADCDTSSTTITRDIFDVARNPEIDVVVELIGGYDVAKELVLEAIKNGKHVVTANKALIAVHGEEIFAAAKEAGVTVGYEAGVAGGIPVIKAIREGLAANKINRLAGIINGTGNFILTEMRDKGRAFGDVLKEAQDLGYAEADPTFDVEGIDAAHKLTILSSIAYGIPLQFDNCFTEGISKVTREDVEYAEELGYRIKHLGVSCRTEAGIDLRVHPTLIPETNMIAKVDGVMNAVAVNGDAVGDTLFCGPGAGAGPTASAVVADIIDIARGIKVEPLSYNSLDDVKVLAIEEIETSYYLRMQANDKAGVLANVASILSNKGINIEAIIQKEPAAGETLVPVIMLTHKVQEKIMNQAISEIEALGDINGSITRIRVEHLN